MDNRRVVVTGMGLISPLGNTKEALWSGLCEGKNAVVPIDGEQYGLPDLRFGAPCSGFTGAIEDFGDLHKDVKRNIRKNVKVMCRETLMAVAAAQKALLDAGVAYDGASRSDTGVMFGSDHMVSDPESTAPAFLACMEDGRLHPEWLGSKGLPQVTPLWLLIWLTNMPGCHISIYNELLGPNNSLTMAESVANATLKYAATTIQRGMADRMVAGATGTRLQQMRCWQVLISEQLADKNLPPAEASRPFDKNHTGQVLGEGAGVIIVESLECARARNATVYAEIIAAADSMAGCQTPDLAQPCLVPDYRRSMTNALCGVLAKSGFSVEDIGFIFAHGLGVPKVDVAEAAAIREVFAQRSTPVPVVSAKGHFGNLGAGAGAVELIAGILALKNGRLFPTLNFSAPAEGCDLNIITDGNTPAGKCFIHLSVNARGQASAVLMARVNE